MNQPSDKDLITPDSHSRITCKGLACKIYQNKRQIRRSSQRGLFEATAIGDLAFLLLIFFIVTSSFILRQGIFLSLPSENAGTMKIESELLVNIYPDNEKFQVDNKNYSRDTLIQFLKKKKQEKSGTIVLIFMRPGIKYHRLVDALSVARESGIKQVSLKNI
jgi:biopolymer transport protein ExbD